MFFLLFILFCRYGRTRLYSDILKKCYEHNRKRECDICKEEENKSKTSPKYQGTAILDLMILPLRQCWICEKTFKTNNGQNEHFRTKHDYGIRKKTNITF